MHIPVLSPLTPVAFSSDLPFVLNLYHLYLGPLYLLVFAVRISTCTLRALLPNMPDILTSVLRASLQPSRLSGDVTAFGDSKLGDSDVELWGLKPWKYFSRKSLCAGV